MRSLLDDIADGGTLVSHDAARSTLDATVAHLRELCSTVIGTVLVAPDYGLDDATRIFLEYPRSEEETRQRLEWAIARHEPRLTEVSVEREGANRDRPSASPPDLLLRFTVSAALLVDGRRVPVRFVSELRRDKLFHVR
jgi:type VI secretion system lysozyme-like protein